MACYHVLPATVHLHVPKEKPVGLLDRVPIVQDQYMLMTLLRQVMHLLFAKMLFFFTCTEFLQFSLFYFYNKKVYYLIKDLSSRNIIVVSFFYFVILKTSSARNMGEKFSNVL